MSQKTPSRETGSTVAVVLSGCGVYDGSEIHEATLTLLALHRHGARARCFAPDADQMHVVDHVTGRVMAGERRNILVESARIARGAIEPLDAFDAAMVDAVIVPGGFGAAKNLSTFAVDGAGCTVRDDVARVIESMVAAGKPVGALCIAPVLLARVLGAGTMTIGHDRDTAAALTAMGATHTAAGHGEVVVDRARKLVTSPCYMLKADIGQIADGADNAVRALLDLI